VAKIAAVTIVLDTLHDDRDKSRENTEATIYPLAAEASQRNASYIINPVFRSINPQHPPSALWGYMAGKEDP
jgi:hypothetical protein